MVNVMATAVATQACVGPAIRCARCGHTVPEDVWRTLPTERRLTRADLAGYVQPWPPNAVVEVRPCSKCGRAIARRIMNAPDAVANGLSWK
jgi:hypothetical protein